MTINNVPKPKAINCQWIWVCPLCDTPVILIHGKAFWGCDCHK